WSSWATLPGCWLSPTAQQFFSPVQRTANSSLRSPSAVPAWFGTLTFSHFLPFQCSTWFTEVALVLPVIVPTAQQSVALLQYTPKSLCDLVTPAVRAATAGAPAASAPTVIISVLTTTGPICFTVHPPICGLRPPGARLAGHAEEPLRGTQPHRAGVQ